MSSVDHTLSADPTCEYGFPVLCGQPATWILYPDKFPTSIYACDLHAPKMASANLSHRLSWAPPLPLPDLKEYVTALAWQVVLLRETYPLRAENARAAFRTARDEYQRRGGQS